MGAAAPFEPINAGDYLWAAFWRLYPCRPEPMGGLRPIDWTDLDAFARCTGRISERWEFEALHDMADAYVRGMIEGRDPFSKDPRDRG